MSIKTTTFLLIFLSSQIAAHGQRVLTTVAGTLDSSVKNGTLATQASLSPLTVAPDGAGNFYIGSTDTNRVLKVDANGKLSLFAGNGFGGYSGDGGLATNASLWQPAGIVADAAGNVYIADARNFRIRKVDSNGIITTVVGSGSGGYYDGGGNALAAWIYFPAHLALDAAGNLFFTDALSVRKVDPTGAISTVAGNGTGFGDADSDANPEISNGDGGPATSAVLRGPVGIAVDSIGNVFFSERLKDRVRRVDTNGIITTIAGDGMRRWAGDGGPAVSASLYYPLGIAMDAAGNLFIADYGNGRVRRVDPNGVITTAAGSGIAGYGDETGIAKNEPLGYVWDVAVDAGGNLLIADYYSGRIRRVLTNGIMTTAAGNGLRTPSPSGQQAVTAHMQPVSLSFDTQQNLLIADGNNLVERVNADGTVTVLAGTGRTGSSGDGGPAVAAGLNNPSGVAMDAKGNLFIADDNQVIRKVDLQGNISTFAKGLLFPQNMVFDKAGNLIVADAGLNRIAQITPAGVVTTVVGNGRAEFSGDGGPALSAGLNNPQSVAFDSAGNLIISDSLNNRIRRVDSKGIITTIAGSGAPFGTPDGPAPTDATLFWPRGLATDSQGNIFFSDTHNNRVFQLTPQGALIPFAGNGNQSFAGDGGPATSGSLAICLDVVRDAKGNVFIADTYNGRVREVLAAAPSAQVSVNTLSFSAPSNGAVTQTQVVSLKSSLDGGRFSLAVATTDGANWLKVNGAQGSMPAGINVSADPTGLPAGTYNGTLTINTPGFSPSAVTVSVSLAVTAQAASQLTVLPGTVNFSVVQQSTPVTQVVFVNSASGTAAFTANPQTDSGGNWLQVAAVNGSSTPVSPGSVTLAVDAGNLAPGTYSGFVLLAGDAGNTKVPVTLTVTAKSRPHIRLSQSGFTFQSVQGGANDLLQDFGVLNTGDGSMSWTATTSAQGGRNWLSVSPTSGTSTANSSQIPLVTVITNTSGMAPGMYDGAITVSSSDADNSPQTIAVKLQILQSGQTKAPSVQPVGLIFTTTQGAASPGSQSSTAYNWSLQGVAFSTVPNILNGSGWLQVSPDKGNLARVDQDSTRAVTVQPTTTGMAAGIYEAQVSFAFSGQTGRNVAVLLVVSPPAGAQGSAGGIAPKSVNAAAGACSPSQLRAVFKQVDDNFNAMVGFPFPLEVNLVDDCGNSMTSGSVVASFSNGDDPISLISLNNGRWSGTWNPVRAGTGPVTITIQAQLPSANFMAAAQRTGNLQ